MVHIELSSTWYFWKSRKSWNTANHLQPLNFNFLLSVSVYSLSPFGFELTARTVDDILTVAAKNNQFFLTESHLKFTHNHKLLLLWNVFYHFEMVSVLMNGKYFTVTILFKIEISMFVNLMTPFALFVKLLHHLHCWSALKPLHCTVFKDICTDKCVQKIRAEIRTFSPRVSSDARKSLM